MAKRPNPFTYEDASSQEWQLLQNDLAGSGLTDVPAFDPQKNTAVSPEISPPKHFVPNEFVEQQDIPANILTPAQKCSTVGYASGTIPHPRHRRSSDGIIPVYNLFENCPGWVWWVSIAVGATLGFLVFQDVQFAVAGAVAAPAALFALFAAVFFISWVAKTVFIVTLTLLKYSLYVAVPIGIVYIIARYIL